MKGDQYYPPYTIKGDGWTARVHRPILTESYELETIGTMDYLRGMGIALVFLAAGIERRKRWKKKKRFE